MKTIILGYEDKDGKGEVTLLAGPEVSQEDQLKLFNAAKHDGKFPADFERLEFCLHDPKIIAISTKTTEPKKKKHK